MAKAYGFTEGDHRQVSSATLRVLNSGRRPRSQRRRLPAPGNTTATGTNCPRLTAALANQTGLRNLRTGEAAYFRSDTLTGDHAVTFDAGWGAAESSIEVVGSAIYESSPPLPSSLALPATPQADDLILFYHPLSGGFPTNGPRAGGGWYNAMQKDGELVDQAAGDILYVWGDEITGGSVITFTSAPRLCGVVILRGVKREASASTFNGQTVDYGGLLCRFIDATDEAAGDTTVDHLGDATYRLAVTMAVEQYSSPYVGSGLTAPAGEGATTLQTANNGHDVGGGSDAASVLFTEDGIADPYASPAIGGDLGSGAAPDPTSVDVVFSVLLPEDVAEASSPPFTCAALEVEDWPLYASQVDDTYTDENVNAAIARYERQRRRIPAIVAGKDDTAEPQLILPASTGVGTVDGVVRAFVYQRHPDDQFYGPPYVNTYRTKELGAPLSDAAGYVGGLWSNGTPGEECIGHPWVLYSYSRGGPFRAADSELPRRAFSGEGPISVTLDVSVAVASGVGTAQTPVVLADYNGDGVTTLIDLDAFGFVASISFLSHLGYELPRVPRQVIQGLYGNWTVGGRKWTYEVVQSRVESLANGTYAETQQVVTEAIPDYSAAAAVSLRHPFVYAPKDRWRESDWENHSAGPVEETARVPDLRSADWTPHWLEDTDDDHNGRPREYDPVKGRIPLKDEAGVDLLTTDDRYELDLRTGLRTRLVRWTGDTLSGGSPCGC